MYGQESRKMQVEITGELGTSERRRLRRSCALRLGRAIREHGRREEGRGGVHEDSRGLTIFRNRGGRRIDAPFRSVSEGTAAHVSVRVAWQKLGDFLCLTDYELPAKNGKFDHVALFVVIAGRGCPNAIEALSF